MPTKKLSPAVKAIRAFNFARWGHDDLDPKAANAHWVTALATKVEKAVRQQVADEQHAAAPDPAAPDPAAPAEPPTASATGNCDC